MKCNVDIERISKPDGDNIKTYGAWSAIYSLANIVRKSLTNNEKNGHGSEAEKLSDRYVLTIEEAALYFHIGERKIRQIIEDNLEKDFYFTNGNRYLIKKKLFEQYIDAATAI